MPCAMRLTTRAELPEQNKSVDVFVNVRSEVHVSKKRRFTGNVVMDKGHRTVTAKLHGKQGQIFKSLLQSCHVVPRLHGF